jgi:hypothetical protein
MRGVRVADSPAFLKARRSGRRRTVVLESGAPMPDGWRTGAVRTPPIERKEPRDVTDQVACVLSGSGPGPDVLAAAGRVPVAAGSGTGVWIGLFLTLVGIFLALAGMVALVTWLRVRSDRKHPDAARVPMRQRRGAVLDNVPTGGGRAIRAALENAQTDDDIARVRQLVLDLELEPALLPDDVRERLGREWCERDYGKRRWRR